MFSKIWSGDGGLKKALLDRNVELLGAVWNPSEAGPNKNWTMDHDHGFIQDFSGGGGGRCI